MFVWPWIGLCLMSAKAIGARGIKFLWCSCFSLSSWFGASLYIPPQNEYADCSSFSCNSLLLYWRPVGIVVKCGWEVAFYNLLIKLQTFSRSVSLALWPSLVFLFEQLSPTSWGETERIQGTKEECPTPMALEQRSDKVTLESWLFMKKAVGVILWWLLVQLPLRAMKELFSDPHFENLSGVSIGKAHKHRRTRGPP